MGLAYVGRVYRSLESGGKVLQGGQEVCELAQSIWGSLVLTGKIAMHKNLNTLFFTNFAIGPTNNNSMLFYSLRAASKRTGSPDFRLGYIFITALSTFCVFKSLSFSLLFKCVRSY